ncbi:MAG: DciA family protein [Solirubrobacteraceae bacterium]
MRRRAPRPVADAVGALLARLAPTSTLAAVQKVWDGAVGDVVAAQATPIGERDGVLTVACTEAVWAHELDLMGPELVERINTALGRQALRVLHCRATLSR